MLKNLRDRLAIVSVVLPFVAAIIYAVHMNSPLAWSLNCVARVTNLATHADR